MMNEALVFQYLENVLDPEVPVLTIIDLGIVRKLELISDHEIVVWITPTYSGCPAMNTIATQIKFELISRGFTQVDIKEQLSPAWTTDWMSEEGKRKLNAYGIAPPQYRIQDGHDDKNLQVPCPLCASSNTLLLSQFGSTSCKALYKCQDCLEPFDYFKCH